MIVFYTFSTGSRCPDVGRVLYVFSGHLFRFLPVWRTFSFTCSIHFLVLENDSNRKKGFPVENYKNTTRTFSRPTQSRWTICSHATTSMPSPRSWPTSTPRMRLPSPIFSGRSSPLEIADLPALHQQSNRQFLGAKSSLKNVGEGRQLGNYLGG